MDVIEKKIYVECMEDRVEIHSARGFIETDIRGLAGYIEAARTIIDMSLKLDAPPVVFEFYVLQANEEWFGFIPLTGNPRFHGFTDGLLGKPMQWGAQCTEQYVQGYTAGEEHKTQARRAKLFNDG